MSKELALVMETPIEKLVPAMLAWNNEELLAAVEAQLESYRGITYDESQVVTAKADRAQLNNFCKILNDERIRIGKIYSSPYDRFKTEVDEVINRVKEVVNEIDTQVKAFELEKQQRKQNEIIEYYKGVVAEFSGLIPYEKIHNPKWLNASTSMKSVKSDIDEIIASARQAIEAITALKSEDEETLKAFYFRTLRLSDALMENERLKAERARVAELKARQEAEAAARAEAQAEQEPEVVQAAAPEEVKAPKLQVVRFQVEGTYEQLKALQKFLRDNNIRFSAI